MGWRRDGPAAQPTADCRDGRALSDLAWASATVIVPAVYNEWPADRSRCGDALVCAPAWLRERFTLHVYQRLDAKRSCYIRNHGFESAVYMRFIADHYRHLPAHVAFMQADWFSAHLRPHSPGLYDKLPTSRLQSYARSARSDTRGFAFWQADCVAHERSPWRHYLPLGKHHSIWPPQFFANVRLEASFNERAGPNKEWSLQHGGAPPMLLDACTRQLLSDFGLDAPPRGVRVSHNYYINNNFFVSRAQLRLRPHEVYVVSSERLSAGLCLAGGVGIGVSDNGTAVTLRDAPRFSKVTGVVMEVRSSTHSHSLNEGQVVPTLPRS